MVKRGSVLARLAQRCGIAPVVVAVVVAAGVVAAVVLWAPLPRAQLMVSLVLGLATSLAAAWLGSRSRR